MSPISKFIAVLIVMLLGVGTLTADAAPCLIVTLTGTNGGPVVFNGQAGAGTLISIGDDSNNCGTVKLQFDAGRGTNMRLSQLNVALSQLNALFFTHMHSDHIEGFADIMHQRWMWYSTGPKLDIVCSDDVISQLGIAMSCRKFVSHIGDALLQSGEIAQRRVEGGGDARLDGGPAELANTITFKATNESQVVWSFGEIKVSAIRSTHIPGHASYRVDSPAGSVVIGGDATNDVLKLPRDRSTSDQVELLAQGADVIVHSAIHPIMGPGQDSGMPLEVYNRQSNATDLGALAQRANVKHLILTHLSPAVGAPLNGVRYKVPGGPLTAADYRKAVEASGYAGDIIVGSDLTSLRLPVQK